MRDGRIQLHYTFGNHQHWVDFHWLWGYYVLPDALEDMRAYCSATGAKGCVNFDGVGYEKLACESPEALAKLREDAQAGRFEIVGGSYAQPYGLFHGGESNIRQRIYGVRSVVRMLGVHPQTFWEEEFDFFPQLPQILRGVGLDKACLYFQWTWHTPEVPMEAAPVVWWEGLDGTRLLTATRNRLNLHQWPEDFQILLDELASDGPEEVLRKGTEDPQGQELCFPPAVVQWLELMPSPDWMCRSELMIPKMQELLNDPRFDLRMTTLGEYLEEVRRAVPDDRIPVRAYRMGDVWHGMSLGKNADHMRRRSRHVEASALSAEALSSVLGMFGRPYAQWDVYPTWELEESWRELLVGQHHDNDECERLCGYVGGFSYDRSLSLSEHILERSERMLGSRLDLGEGEAVVVNPLGWARDVVVEHAQENYLVRDVPGFGWAPIRQIQESSLQCVWEESDVKAVGKLGATTVTIDRQTGLIEQIFTAHFPDGLLQEPLGLLTQVQDGQVVYLKPGDGAEWSSRADKYGTYVLEAAVGDASVILNVDIDPLSHAVEVGLMVFDQPKPDGGMNSGLQTRFAFPVGRLLADQPLSITPVDPYPKGLKKYPTGDWMTSPQWFEEVHGSFTALSTWGVDYGGRAIAVVHDGSQQWFQDESGYRCLLSMYDPWDEEHFDPVLFAHFRISTHERLNPAQMWKQAQEHLRFCEVVESTEGPRDIPSFFEPIRVEPSHVLATAFHRETDHDGKRFANYAGNGLSYPFVLRLVEWDGKKADVSVSIAGTVAQAFRTNLLGQIEETLDVTTEGHRSTVRLRMEPHQIATLYLDIEEGRKQFRDLDAHRNVWATVHRVDG